MMSVWFVLLINTARANDLSGILTNNQGVKAFVNKKPVEAFDHFSAALGELPYSAQIHFNLATSFLANQEYDKALSEYTEVLRDAAGPTAQERELRFLAQFNSGVAFTAQKKTDEALMAYQLALNEKPDSVEAKTNIELLTAQQQGGGKGDKDQDSKDQKDQPKDQSKDQQKDSKDQKDQKDKNDKSKDQPKDQPKDQQKDQQPPKATPKPTPRPFNEKQPGQELTEKDVGKILDELKRQEEQIRARMQNEKPKDAPVGKDW